MTITKEAFLERRRSGIGGSDIAAIIGISPWKTPRDIYLAKKGLAENEPATEAMYWGTVLEDVVAKEYALRTGRKIERCSIQFQHKEYPFLVGNLDRLVWADNGHKPIVKGELRTDRILECKTASQYAAGEWGEAGTQDIPEHYKCQVQWYLGITGALVCDVAVLIGNRDFRIYEIPRNEKVISYLFQEGVNFWRDYIETDTMPPAKTLEDVERLSHGTPKERRFAPDPVVDAVKRYAELDAQAKAIKEEQDALKVTICDCIGDAVELASPDGVKLATWSAAKPVEKTDWKAVAAEMGAPADIVAKHTVESMGPRRFMLASRK